MVLHLNSLKLLNSIENDNGASTRPLWICHVAVGGVILPQAFFECGKVSNVSFWWAFSYKTSLSLGKFLMCLFNEPFHTKLLKSQEKKLPYKFRRWIFLGKPTFPSLLSQYLGFYSKSRTIHLVEVLFYKVNLKYKSTKRLDRRPDVDER